MSRYVMLLNTIIRVYKYNDAIGTWMKTRIFRIMDYYNNSLSAAGDNIKLATRTRWMLNRTKMYGFVWTCLRVSMLIRCWLSEGRSFFYCCEHLDNLLCQI